jgi:hypothetical protein
MVWIENHHHSLKILLFKIRACHVLLTGDWGTQYLITMQSVVKIAEPWVNQIVSPIPAVRAGAGRQDPHKDQNQRNDDQLPRHGHIDARRICLENLFPDSSFILNDKLDIRNSKIGRVRLRQIESLIIRPGGWQELPGLV